MKLKINRYKKIFELQMENLVIAKFGGSVIGNDGSSIPMIMQRIQNLKKDSKIIAVFSAPLTFYGDRLRSLTDIVLEGGEKVERTGEEPNLTKIINTYDKIQQRVNDHAYKVECQKLVKSYLEKSKLALIEARDRGEFANEVRSRALAFSGELLMSQIMAFIMKSNGIRAEAIDFDNWPIITDKNIESTNFLYFQSSQRMKKIEKLVTENEVVSIGGFIGKTVQGIVTTYERGGSDRTAADLGILFHKKYNTRIDFEKDNVVVSADPKIVTEKLDVVKQLSYNEARLAGMFGMKILDPIAIKEILENGVDLPIIITNMKDPSQFTTIKRTTDKQNDHPLKIVTGKRNCAIIRIEKDMAEKLQNSLEKDKRYSEYIVLSPFIKDGIQFSRLLFLDGDYVKRNEKYILSFDSLATITYNRGVVTLIGDEMWRIQQIASKTSSRIGEAGLNILNMDAQEETSRIIIIIEDSADNIPKAIKSIHEERAKIKLF